MLSPKWIELIARALRPPPDLSVSEWADSKRVLSEESSASPGRWYTERAEYLRGIMDAMSDPSVETVVVAGCSQFGKTEVHLNVIGYHMEHDPAPILEVQPTLTIAEAFSKDRLGPMLRDTPSLSALFDEAKTRESGNTVLHKQFENGHITMAGANSPASLASRPIRIVLCDEINRYERSAGTEGDPVDLAWKRAKAFWNKKRLLTSSPTTKRGRITKAFESSDRRYYMVKCPHCEEEQRLHWNPLAEDLAVRDRVAWVDDDPETARYVCSSCAATWEEPDRLAAIRDGRWVATRRFRGTAGFHVSGCCLAWQPIPKLVYEWLEVQRSGNVEQTKVFINTEIGDVYEDEGKSVEADPLRQRAESWEGTPPGVLFTTVGVDVQGDRLEAELVGWGDREESWSLEYRVFTGDPGTPQVWEDLDRWLLSARPAAACIDSGGHHTQAVYRFCSARFRRRVYAIKGQAGEGKVVWPRVASRGKGGHRVYVIGVDAAKDSLFAALRVTSPGQAGYCHFPAGREEWWFGGLTSEAVYEKHSKTTMMPVREYRRRSGFRNEPLDCRVYAFAALCSFGRVSWSGVAARRAARQAKGEEPQEGAREARPASEIATEAQSAAPPAQGARPAAPGGQVPRGVRWRPLPGRGWVKRW